MINCTCNNNSEIRETYSTNLVFENNYTNYVLQKHSIFNYDICCSYLYDNIRNNEIIMVESRDDCITHSTCTDFISKVCTNYHENCQFVLSPDISNTTTSSKIENEGNGTLENAYDQVFNFKLDEIEFHLLKTAKIHVIGLCETYFLCFDKICSKSSATEFVYEGRGELRPVRFSHRLITLAKFIQTFIIT